MEHFGLIVLSSVAVFGGVIALLVTTILIAEAKLVAKGDVRLNINDDAERSVSVPAGRTLLASLSESGINLPSACGGKGTCGVCKCRVLKGGGELLPTETGFINRKMGKEDWRLACQVKVRENMDIRVPDEIFSIKEWECEVVSNKNVATFIKEFVVKLPEGEVMDFQSGGYIQIEIPPYDVDFRRDVDVEEKFREEWEKFKLFELKAKNTEPETIRAYSMANHPAEGNIVMLNIRIATPPFDRKKGGWMNVPPGICSSYVFSRKPGDKIKISGAYGEFFILDTDREMIYIGGGAGMAPLRSHIFHLFHTLKTGRQVSYWYGARSEQEIFYEEEFREIEKNFPNFKFHIALSDVDAETAKQTGRLQGFIHQALYDHYLKDHPNLEDVEFYMCGPPLMAQAVLKMLDDQGVEQDMILFDDFGG